MTWEILDKVSPRNKVECYFFIFNCAYFFYLEKLLLNVVDSSDVGDIRVGCVGGSVESNVEDKDGSVT